jgi:hypothetical protein
MPEGKDERRTRRRKRANNHARMARFHLKGVPHNRIFSLFISIFRACRWSSAHCSRSAPEGPDFRRRGGRPTAIAVFFIHRVSRASANIATVPGRGSTMSWLANLCSRILAPCCNSHVYFFRMRLICERYLQQRAKAVSRRLATALQDASAYSRFFQIYGFGACGK